MPGYRRKWPRRHVHCHHCGWRGTRAEYPGWAAGQGKTAARCPRCYRQVVVGNPVEFSPSFRPLLVTRPYEPPKPRCQFYSGCRAIPTVDARRMLELEDGSVRIHGEPLHLCDRHAEEVRSTWEKV